MIQRKPLTLIVKKDGVIYAMNQRYTVHYEVGM